MVLPSATCWAVMARAAATTLASVKDYALPMIELASTELPIIRTIEHQPWPDFWQASCPGVRLAKRDAACTAVCKVPAAELRAARAALAHGARQAALGEHKVQRGCYSAFLQTRWPDKVFLRDFASRLDQLFPGPAPADLPGHLVQELARAKPHTAQCAWRTLLNAWPTGARLHVLHGRSPPPCRLGCSVGTDEFLSHYWCQCPRFAALTKFAWGRRIDPSLIDSFWGCNPARTGAVPVLASMYTAYSSLHRLTPPVSQRDLEDLFISARAAHSRR